MDSARDYVQLYHGDKEMLLASLERIRQTAGEIIEGIMPQKLPSAEVQDHEAELAQTAAV